MTDPPPLYYSVYGEHGAAEAMIRTGDRTMKKSIHMDALTLGVCYYPEHWPNTLWEEDLARMKEAGISVIRVAEFAWNRFEPSEGSFTFSFFDSFMIVAERAGMDVIFCTPTATPPAWLTEKHPEVLNATRDGILYRHGVRRHYNYHSPVYRDYAARIVTQLAKHYGAHPNIIGWQIDNELNCEVDVFYSDADHAAFRNWLKDKYTTLDALNEAWGTVFWNQTYSDWNEVFLPRFTGYNNSANPHMVLDQKRFISDGAVSFAALQYGILRKYAAGRQFITTNGLFGHLNYDDLLDQAVDFITYDSYPTFGFENLGSINAGGFGNAAPAESTYNLNDRKWAWNLAMARAFSPNFGVMEQQSGAGGWVDRMQAATPRRGQIRLWTLQSIAHGADFVSYFRWRTCSFGTEIYWHGILNYDNRLNRRLAEISALRNELFALNKVAGSTVRARLAIVRDYDNVWDGEFDIWHGPLRDASESAWVTAAERDHVPFDVVFLNEKTQSGDLAQYDLMVYTHAPILTEETAALLNDYVRQGGTLIMGARTGYKDRRGHCPMRDMPGPVADLFGIRIDDFTHLNFKNARQTVRWDEDVLEAILFNDILEPTRPDTRILATYIGGDYDGFAAFTAHPYGNGTAYYFGAAFAPETARRILHRLGFAEPYADRIDLPESCELTVRENDGASYLFVLNFGDDRARITLKQPFTDAVDGTTVQGPVTLPAYDVRVFTF